MTFRQYLESIVFQGNYQTGFYQRLVAAKYQLSPDNEPRAKAAWESLWQKISKQHKLISSKYKMIPTPESVDKYYPDTSDLRKNINQQKTQGINKPSVLVYDQEPGPEGEKGHPHFSKEQNTITRFVHDMIAHYPQKQGGSKNDQGYPFITARGEFGAYNRHLKTICPDGSCLAAKALFTEIIGQTCWYFVYGGFTRQKTIILDDFDHAKIGLLCPTSPLNKYFTSNKHDLIPKNNFNNFFIDFPELSAELERQEKSNRALFTMSPIRSFTNNHM